MEALAMCEIMQPADNRAVDAAAMFPMKVPRLVDTRLPFYFADRGHSIEFECRILSGGRQERRSDGGGSQKSGVGIEESGSAVLPRIAGICILPVDDVPLIAAG